MTNLTITLDEEQLQQFQQIAQQMGLAVEDLIRLSIGEYLTRRKNFEKAAEQVRHKNEDLYHRLAK